ncbi:Protein phosphatase 1 regulatory subunit 12A [Hondaea fermentalgiana]|uniref:Protein phosphatase 1 regulatory subunit 12A n=1 Tax=Hondaea fermentalgiana TaxID=2315210 RepID=A0A2R5G327_9STRA|nr:Protein phosphatase 1 regulatory subunit 12A [Hondaea fermentalgiana]|eukprot:GBG24935.1 Protein phosphatase 1 regulatory subunit 12A [Hondaea fermentalgiana]
MGFFVRTIPLRKRRAKLHKHLIELMQRCASGDPAGVQSAVKKIDPFDKLSGNARELETMVQNFVETAVRMACSSRQLAVLRPLCEASHWTFEVQVGEDRRSFCDRILDVVLVCALSHVNIAGVRLVLSYEDWRPRAHHQFILVACRCNKVDIIQELLGDKRMRGVANQKQWIAAALESARNMRMESLRAIVNAKVLPDNSVGEGAIVMSACAKGQTGLVSELLADPNMPVKTLGLGALHIAASKGHVETMRILLDDARIRPESDGWKALDSAAVGGHLLATVELLERMRKSGSAQAARTRALRAASAWPRSYLAMEAILDAEDHRGGELDTLGLECMARVCGWDLDTPDISAIQASGLVRRFAESALSQDFVDLLGPDLVLWAIRAEDVELLQLLLAHDAVQLYGRDAEDALSSACASETTYTESEYG